MKEYSTGYNNGLSETVSSREPGRNTTVASYANEVERYISELLADKEGKDLEEALTVIKSKYPNAIIESRRGIHYDVLVRARKKLFEHIMAADDSSFVDVLQQELVTIADLAPYLHEMKTDAELLALLPYAKNCDEFLEVIKWVVDPAGLRDLEVPDLPSKTFDRHETTIYLAAQLKALQEELDITPAFHLLSQNKFVFGLDAGNKQRYALGWSNVDDCEYHRDIFMKMPNAIPRIFRTGGHLKLSIRGNTAVVTLEGRSTDFGHYNQRLMETRHEEIHAALLQSVQEIYQDVTSLQLVIEPSSIEKK